MKIFLEADIKTNTGISENKAESPISRSHKAQKKSTPAFMMKKNNSLSLSGILATQHPVMLSWLAISFILISVVYIYTVITL